MERNGFNNRVMNYKNNKKPSLEKSKKIITTIIATGVVIALFMLLFVNNADMEESKLNNIKPSVEEFSPSTIFHCNRVYYDTKYTVSWNDADKNSSKSIKNVGVITFTPPKKPEGDVEFHWGMSTEDFNSSCQHGDVGGKSKSCNNFQLCISVVKHLNPIGDASEFTSLGFSETAKYINDYLEAKKISDLKLISDEKLGHNRILSTPEKVRKSVSEGKQCTGTWNRESSRAGEKTEVYGVRMFQGDLQYQVGHSSEYPIIWTWAFRIENIQCE